MLYNHHQHHYVAEYHSQHGCLKDSNSWKARTQNCVVYEIQIQICFSYLAHIFLTQQISQNVCDSQMWAHS